jgi:hypothetical protein
MVLDAKGASEVRGAAIAVEDRVPRSLRARMAKNSREPIRPIRSGSPRRAMIALIGKAPVAKTRKASPARSTARTRRPRPTSLSRIGRRFSSRTPANRIFTSITKRRPPVKEPLILRRRRKMKPTIRRARNVQAGGGGRAPHSWANRPHALSVCKTYRRGDAHDHVKAAPCVLATRICRRNEWLVML